jgi:predicted N-acetyltransferase YhbS
MREADAAAVAELANELGYPSTGAHINKRIRTISESDLLLVSVDKNDKSIAFVQAHPVCVLEAGFRVEILGLVVSSKARRMGIGQKLVAEVEAWARTLGTESVVVRSNTKRIESHLFYPALSYNVVKTQAVYEKKLVS